MLKLDTMQMHIPNLIFFLSRIIMIITATATTDKPPITIPAICPPVKPKTNEHKLSM